MLYYTTKDKDRLVSGDDPAAHFVINVNAPGEFAGLLRAREAELAAQAATPTGEAQTATTQPEAPELPSSEPPPSTATPETGRTTTPEPEPVVMGTANVAGRRRG